MRPTLRTTTVAIMTWIALWGVAGCEGERPDVTPTPVVTRAAPLPVAVAHEGGEVGRPTRVEIPTIGVAERLHGVGLLPDGAMETPDFGDAGWYERGPRPGAPGPAVLVAHVHGPAGDDVFARLHELETGDRVTVRREGGTSTFVVTGVAQAPKDSLPYDRIWSDTRRPVLRLITCGGTPDPVTRAYPENTIVYAQQMP